MGYASSMAWVLFVIVLVLTLLIFRSSPMWVYYEGEVKKMTSLVRTIVSSNESARRRQTINKSVIYLLLIGGALIYMLPLIVMASTSFKPFTEINTYPPTFLPNEWRPSNYPEAWNYGVTQFPRWTLNTVIILVAILPGVLITSSLCAYGFARLKFPGRNICFMLVLASIMLPPQVTLIPLLYCIQQDWLAGYVLAVDCGRPGLGVAR